MSLFHTKHPRQRVLPAVATFSMGVGLIALSAMVYGVVRQPDAEPQRDSLMAVDAPALRAAAPPPGQMIRFVEAPAPAASEATAPAETEPAAVHDPAQQPTAPKAAAPAGPTFDGRPIRKTRTVRMLVTAYSPDERSCGIHADGITASGYSVWTNGMKMVAADRNLPFGTLISIPGYNGGRPVPVLDRGGRIKGNRLDVLYPTHEIARQWGAQRLEVTVWEYAD